MFVDLLFISVWFLQNTISYFGLNHLLKYGCVYKVVSYSTWDRDSSGELISENV
jgi:hypothetical protein